MGPQWSPIRVERSSLRFHQRFSDTPRKTQLTFLNILNVSMLKDVFSASSVVYFCDLLCMWHDFVHLLMADQYFQYIYIYIFSRNCHKISNENPMVSILHLTRGGLTITYRNLTNLLVKLPAVPSAGPSGCPGFGEKKNDVWNATGRLAD